MKEAFEKIKERLEERLKFYENRFDEMNGTDKDVEDWGSIKSYKDAIRIVNEVSEEYNKEHNKEHNKEYNTDGWIPVSERLPEERENPVTMDWYVYPVMVNFADIIDIRYYSFGNGHWHYGPSIMDRYVTHWMDIAPYQPKGE